MAQITYTNKVALNVNPNVPDINKVVDSDMNQIKEVVNQNENKYLLAVSSSAPAQCSTGDVYFNTTTNLLYTATATNTWGNTGVVPTSNTLYIVIETQTTYTYNGTTLVSVGGGSGSSDIVMVYPDTPTEDTKLYIEESDLGFQGLEIATLYNDATNMAYSCDYSNKAFGGTILWTNSSPTSNYGANDVIIANLSDYDIVKIIFKRSTSSSIQFEVNLYLYEAITNSVATFFDGTTQYLRGVSANKTTNKASFERSQIPNVGFHDDTNIPIYIIGYKTGLFS